MSDKGMKAVVINEFGGSDTLQIVHDHPIPKPDNNEIRIRIHAAGINPVDWKIREGMLSEMFPHQFPIILGWDVAGTVDAVANEDSRFKVGDAVYSYVRKPIIQDGAYAEYIVVDEDSVAHKPQSLLFNEAAAVPLAALTAYQALFDKHELTANHTILIHAAAGGVGHFAVQLAKLAGATVIATAGTTNKEFLADLQADEIIDYNKQDFVEVIKQKFPNGIDRVLDGVGGDVQNRSIEVLKAGGHMVSITTVPDKEKIVAVGATSRHHFVVPNSKQLEILANLFDSNKLKVHVEKLYPLNEVLLALQHSQRGHTRGKTVLVL